MNISTATTSGSEHKLPGSSIVQSMLNAIAGTAAYFRKRRRSRATYMALSSLNDHMLKDIGLSRADVVDLETFGRGR